MAGKPLNKEKGKGESTMENIVSRYAEIINSLGLSGFLTVVLPTHSGATAYHSAMGTQRPTGRIQSELVELANGVTFDRVLDGVHVTNKVCEPALLYTGIVRKIDGRDELFRTWCHELMQDGETIALFSIVDSMDWVVCPDVRRKLTSMMIGLGVHIARACES